MNASHHPDVLTSFSGRTDETSRPNVGIVHRNTRARTMYRPPRLDSEALTDRPIGSPPIAASTVAASGSLPEANVAASTDSVAAPGATVGSTEGSTVLM